MATHGMTLSPRPRDAVERAITVRLACVSGMAERVVPSWGGL